MMRRLFASVLGAATVIGFGACSNQNDETNTIPDAALSDAPLVDGGALPPFTPPVDPGGGGVLPAAA